MPRRPRSNGWLPQRLELELTESALIRDSEALRRCFDLFEQNGVLLAVDDFGTGFSNLHYLNRFPVQRLKIDYEIRDAGTGQVLTRAHTIQVAVLAATGELQYVCPPILWERLGVHPQ